MLGQYMQSSQFVLIYAKNRWITAVPSLRQRQHRLWING
jgi:hypothetical protein